MMKMKTGMLGMLALSVWMMATAMTANAQTISKAVTSRSFTNGSPTNVTSVFKPRDSKIHAFVSFARPFPCTMKSVWYAVNAKGFGKNQKLYEMSLKRDNYRSGHFSLSNNNPWGVGTYRIDVYANAKKIRTLNFSVK